MTTAKKAESTGKTTSPQPTDPVKMLEAIEESIAMTDRQRLLILKTTKPAVATVLSRKDWAEVHQRHAVTLMLARRMFNHYSFQKGLKEEISLSRIASASEVFQQAVGAYLRAYLEGVDPAFEVKLEKAYGKLVPDIAVERNGTRVAAIEVKTTLGYQRDYIHPDDIADPLAKGWKARREQCKDEGFGSSYLLMLANTNQPAWKSWMGELGVRVLLKMSPNDDPQFKWYQNRTADIASDFLHPVEQLFEEIGKGEINYPVDKFVSELER